MSKIREYINIRAIISFLSKSLLKMEVYKKESRIRLYLDSPYIDLKFSNLEELESIKNYLHHYLKIIDINLERIKRKK